MMECLTPAERRLVELLGQGKTPAQIADDLCVSRKTVWEYTYRVRQKTGFRSTLELAIEAAITLYVPA